MAVATAQPQPMSVLQRHSRPSGLADVLDVILDKGIVIDVFVRVALIGIELLTIDARIVVASVDTYLHFAEAVNRLDLAQAGKSETLPEAIGDMEESGAGRKSKGMLEGAKEALFGGGDEDEGSEGDRERSSRSGRSSGNSHSRSRRSSSSGRSSSSSSGRSSSSSSGRSSSSSSGRSSSPSRARSGSRGR